MKKRYHSQTGVGNPLVLTALRFFADNPYQEIYLREFGRKLGISPNSAQRFLNLFLKNNLIIGFKKGNLRYFRANLDSIVFRNIKITFSLKRIEDSGLIDFLKDKFTNAVLFGSISNGIDNGDSDIDMICIGIKREADLSLFEKKLGKEINAHFFTLAQWKEQKNKNKAFYQDVIGGINLVGELPFVD